MTHDRFLLLKGIEILGYARELPANAKLPFFGLANIPSPKTVIPLDKIKSVNVEEDKLIVRHADASNTVWEFICPSKRCAIEWNQKIQEAMILLKEFENSGFGSPAEFYQFRAGGLGSEPGSCARRAQGKGGWAVHPGDATCAGWVGHPPLPAHFWGTQDGTVNSVVAYSGG